MQRRQGQATVFDDGAAQTHARYAKVQRDGTVHEVHPGCYLAPVADMQQHVRHVVRIHAAEAVRRHAVVGPRDKPEVLHTAPARPLRKRELRVLVALAQLGAREGDGDAVEIARTAGANDGWEVSLTLPFLVLDEVGGLHDEPGLVLPDHADEGVDGGRQGPCHSENRGVCECVSVHMPGYACMRARVCVGEWGI